MKKRNKNWVVIIGLIFGAIGALAGLVYIVDRGCQGTSSEYRELPIEYHQFPIHLAADKSFGLRPIHLQDNQRLHFTWQVLQGDEITVGFVTPTGEYFGFCADSNRLEKDSRVPLKSGSAAFRPLEYGWGAGYYEVQMTGRSQITELEVRWWID